MPDTFQPPPHSWIGKFAYSFRGLARGARGDSSFAVHFVMMVAVLAAAAVFRVTMLEWYILILCITIVIAGEYFNSAMESLGKAVTRDSNEHVRDALDISSAAVLILSFGAAILGLMIFVPYLAKFIPQQ